MKEFLPTADVIFQLTGAALLNGALVRRARPSRPGGGAGSRRRARSRRHHRAPHRSGRANGERPRACLADSCLRPRDDRRTSVELVSRHPNPSVANGLQSTLPPARPRATRFDACCAPRSAASLAARRPSIVTGVRLGPLAPVQDVTRVHGSNPTGDLALRASPGRAHVPREFWVKDGLGRAIATWRSKK